MIDYFTEREFLDIKNQRRKVLAIYFLILGIYALISVGLFLWYRTLPYLSSKIIYVKLVHYSITPIFVIFSLIYLGIVFRRVNRFYKVCFNLLNAKKDTSQGIFVKYDEAIQQKDGVDYKALIFAEWNKYKNESFNRKVLVFCEWDFPEIPKDASVKYLTQNNVLVSYEIL